MEPTPPVVHIDAPNLGADTMHDLLAAEHRHRVLWALEQADGFVLTATLAAHLAEGTDTDSVEVEKTLIHKHLPRLADAGVIEYDRKSGAVALAPAVQVDVAGTAPATDSSPKKTDDVAND